MIQSLLPVEAVNPDGVPVTIESVHQVADLFPLIDNDELGEMVDSILTEGQHTPGVVLDGVLLDGRNRVVACLQAGVVPVVAEYLGDDSSAFMLSTNINRRHLNKGQRAMIAAVAFSETEKTQPQVASEIGVSTGRIGQAAMVLKFAPELTDSVIAGATPLDAAYKTARGRKHTLTDSKDLADSTVDRLASLAEKAPDLAEEVKQEKRTLEEAESEWKNRETERRERAMKWAEDDRIAAVTLAKYQHSLPRETMRELWPIARSEYPELPEQIRAAAKAALQLADELEQA